MASPKIEVLFFFNASTGTPLTGLTPTFSSYKDDLGVDVTQPSITEIGGGAYKFTPTFADPDRGIIYVIDGGASAAPRYYSRFMRPEDWAEDDIAAIQATVERLKLLKEGRWKIFTTGGDAGRLVLYAADNTTVIQKWDLKDATGAANINNVYERLPVLSIP